jgi:hypothetical protein
MTPEELIEASATEREVLHRLRQNGELTQNQLATLVGGKRITVIGVANRMVDEGVLSCRAGKRGAKVYDIKRADPDPEPLSDIAPGVREQVVLRSKGHQTGWDLLDGSASFLDAPRPVPDVDVVQRVELGFGLCMRCDLPLLRQGSFCDPCATLSRQEAGLGG